MTTDHNDAGQTADDKSLMARIARARLVARAVILIERLVVASLPLLGVMLSYAALSWFGVFRHAPLLLANGLLVLFVAVFLASLLPFRRFSLPSLQEAESRLESKSGLAHQAITALSDRPANAGDAMADVLWKAHRRQLMARIGLLAAGEPSPDLPRRDPFAVRALIVCLVFIGWGFSFGPWGGRLTDAFVARPATPEQVAAMRVDAWVTPPAYTSRPPVYLTSGQANLPAEIKVPQYSILTVRLADGDAVPALVGPDGQPRPMMLEADKKTALDPKAQAKPDAARTFVAELSEDSSLTLGNQTFRFALIADTPPTIDFAKEPDATVNGALEISIRAKDDYGIAEAHAEIVPLENEPGAMPLFDPPEYKLDIPGRAKTEIKSTTSRDLTEHPLSGKKVRLTLVAKDARGQIARSPSRDIILPARPFTQELAASIVEQRQVFSLDVNKIVRALELNEASTIRPEETAPKLSHYLAVKSAANRLKLVRDAVMLKEASDYFWEVARGIEDGDLADAEKRLKDAQNKLSEALKRGAGDEEIKQLMAELRKAMDQYLQELAKRNQPGDKQNSQMAGKVLRSQDLQKMLDQLENLARSGARDQAQQLLNDMQRMMNNLNTARPNEGQQQNSPMREQIDKLGRIIQEQQQLMDETHKLEQALKDRQQRGDPGEQQFGEPQDPFGEDGMNDPSQPPDQGEQADPGTGEPQGAPEDKMTAEELKKALKALKERQDALSEGLGQLQKKLSELGMKPMPGFGEGKKSMKDAAGALGQSDGDKAVSEQGKALEALRKGASQMMQAMMQAQGQRQGQNQPGGQQGQEGRDPLGRQANQAGDEVDGSVKVPDEIDIQRAREILEEIRKRLSDGGGSAVERDYLERLLDLGRQAVPEALTP